MSIELKPGDYVLTKDIEGELNERAVVQAFRQAGCDMQHYEGYDFGHEDFFSHENVGWSMSSGFAGGVAEFNRRRRLIPGQILDAEPGIDVTRIATEPPAWDGKGLPPVGAICEYWTDAAWEECEIIARKAGKVVFWHPRHERAYQGPVEEYDFRPIRSEEDRAVDEMLSVVEHSEGHYTLCGSMADAMRKLYRAGLRFPEKEGAS